MRNPNDWLGVIHFVASQFVRTHQQQDAFLGVLRMERIVEMTMMYPVMTIPLSILIWMWIWTTLLTNQSITSFMVLLETMCRALGQSASKLSKS
jgi:hypothetical protein